MVARITLLRVGRIGISVIVVRSSSDSRAVRWPRSPRFFKFVRELVHRGEIALI